MSDNKFSTTPSLNLPEINREMLETWKREHLFEATLKLREGAPRFVFYEGPPSANGLPGIHHVIARTIKDIFCRYKTMQGYLVDRKAGWDTHGLPVELGVEKKLGITKADIGTKISVEEYNDACRKEVMKYTAEWESLTDQMGYWVDMKDPYITYDNRYIETLWYLLKRLYDEGLLYKGYTIQPYSPAAGTGLSSHELNQPGTYRDVRDTMATVLFRMKDPMPELRGHGEAYFMAWTTTPWTLPSNTALAVGPKMDYVAVRTYNPYTLAPITIVMGEPLLPRYFKKEGLELPLETPEKGTKTLPYRLLDKKWKGTELTGLAYEQLFPWINPGEGAFRVISGDFVTTDDGTGIVHIAPTFGADDNKVAAQTGVPGMLLLTREGKERPMVDFTGKYYLLDELDPDFVKERVNVEAYKAYEGRYVKNVYDDSIPSDSETLDISLSMELKAKGLAFRIEKETHSYPHCWRTDKPILYYPLDSWFIRSTAKRDEMIALNRRINWKPENTGTGRFGKWLENLQDWNLSRSRFWGTPLPIWTTEDGRETKCIGSVEELMKEVEKSVKAGNMKANPWKDFVPGDNSKENYDRIDLHRPYVDDLILTAQDGSPMYREADLVDVWFDSGAMPYAQLHYPFENRALIDDKQYYPADFIAEGVDQTRGWFFTLHALGTMLFGSEAFRNVVSNGLVLDKNGNKMSKRLGNSVDPFETIRTKGSDPLRWYMITNASPWDNLRFDPAGVDEVARKFFGTLYNTYSFFALYANIDGFDPETAPVPFSDRPELDRWILSRLSTLVDEVTRDLEDYEPTKAGRAISDFVENLLSNWYVRLSRKRFWGKGMTEDKLAAYQTLYACLDTIARLIAPFAPFYADALYRALKRDDSRSVHLADFPHPDSSVVNKPLELAMSYAQSISSMVLALRRKMDTKVRQPLRKVLVLTNDPGAIDAIEHVRKLILTEVNVKELEIVTGSAAGIVVKRIKPNFKVLGPIFGKQMKEAAACLTDLDQEAIADFEQKGTLDCLGRTVSLSDVEIISEDVPGWLVLNEGHITVALDETITPELKREGYARELVNKIQNLRKTSGFEVSDKIAIRVKSGSDLLEQTLSEHRSYIMEQVQALSLDLVSSWPGDEAHETLEIDEGFNVEAVITRK